LNSNLNGAGCFWLSTIVCDTLIRKASALQICTYLTLARFTDCDGQFCTAGRTAVKKALGFGDRLADVAIESILQLTVADTNDLPLVVSSARYEELGNEPIFRPTLKSQVRYHLLQPENDNEKVWFSNNIVSGHGDFEKPLKDLRRLGDNAAKVLLLCYRFHDMEQYGGVAPSVLSHTYDAKYTNTSLHGYHLWHGVPNTSIQIDKNLISTLLPALKDSGVDEADFLESVQTAVDALQTVGFIYEVVTVFESSLNQGATVIYELDARSRHGYKPYGEEGLGGLTARLAGFLKKPVTRPGALFSGRYAAFLEAGVQPEFYGILRLRFRVSNPKNHTVSSSFRRISGDQKHWKLKIEKLLMRYEDGVFN
jgi:hypothetical protein